MSPVSPALIDKLRPIIESVSAGLHKGYPKLAAEDIAQAMWVRANERWAWFADEVDQGHFGLVREELRRAGWRACKSEEREQRAKRAAEHGYDVDDEQFYTLGLLRALLPGFVVNGVTEQPPVMDRGKRGASLKSETGDYLAMMCDLSAGMDKVAPHERRIIRQWFALPQGDDYDSRSARSQFANSAGQTLNAVEQRVTRALRSLQKALGGDNPWRRAPVSYDATVATGRTPQGVPSKDHRELLAMR